jgi:hypothetical protein
VNTALIAEYLAAAKPPAGLQCDFVRANALALRCIMELPSSTWERIVLAVMHPQWESALALALDIRGELHPNDPIERSRMVYHGPGAGMKP